MYSWHTIAYPKMVILITTKYKEKDNIITVAWHSPLSFSPPLYGIAIGKKRFSHDLIKNSKEFGVNFVDSKLEEKILCCGKISGKNIDKFRHCKLTRKKAKKINSPLIKEAVAWLECKVVNEVDVGDHTFFVGEILAYEEKSKERLYHKSGETFMSMK